MIQGKVEKVAGHIGSRSDMVAIGGSGGFGGGSMASPATDAAVAKCCQSLVEKRSMPEVSER